MAGFIDEDMSGAVFRECDLSGARLIGVVFTDVEIDGLIGEVTINGVEMSGYVAAELDRRYPVRPLIRSGTPAGLRAAHAQLREAWVGTVARLHGLPPGTEYQQVGGEWSAVQTLRHLAFVHDSWFRRCCLGSTEPFTAFGIAIDGVPEQDVQALDPSADPSLEEVLAVRATQTDELAQWFSVVTADALAATAPVPEGPGWPPYARGKSVSECVGVVLTEELEHHRFCVRDLDLIHP